LINHDHIDRKGSQLYFKLLFINNSNLTKTVKELTNKTCGEYIDEMVIAEAKILLGNLSYSVAQVADELHFSDQFFFAKFFKKHAGVTPSDYRKEA